MNEFPLARITAAHALKHGNDLIIYVEGLTSGFGGRLVVERSPNLILPTQYDVRAIPGNDGINPDASPQDVPTVAAYAFPNEGFSQSILLQGADDRRELNLIATQAPEAVQQTDGMGTPDCEWEAVHDSMPPGPARLRVTGTCVMPTPGYTLTLSRAEPQGFNPRILILNLEVEAPTGFVAQVLTPTPVAYEETTDLHYDSISIEPGNAQIPVQEIS